MVRLIVLFFLMECVCEWVMYSLTFFLLYCVKSLDLIIENEYKW